MKKNYGQIYTAPLLIWITVFFVVPIAIILMFSFLKKDVHGGVELKFSIAAYKALFNPYIIKVAFSTIFISIMATLIIVFLALPTAYYMARSKFKDFLMLLIIIPFWTNFLIRIYAWIAILGNNGILNGILLKLGLADHNIQFLYNQWTVIIVMAYTYLPFAILPLFSTIEKFDFSLLEAARDLGATKTIAVIKILLPNVMPGITTAVLFTFIPVIGNYAVPQLVGGSDSIMIGNIITHEIMKTRNWPLASSISLVLTVLSTIGVMLFMYMTRSKTDDLRKIREDAT